MSTTAIARADGGRVGRAMIVADAIGQEAEQRRLLGEYVKSQMVEGTDYGVIPGTERKDKDGKPAPTPKTLLKPGAEKLTGLYRCVPRFILTAQVENWDTGLFYYQFKCQIVTLADDLVVAEGVGSCSTYESRYRWRTADRVCPECGQPAIKRSKFPPRDDPDAAPGWYCHAKAGGCGANFDADDPAIIDQKTGRVQNPDLFDAQNTVLKMAKKRAHVDAAIALARCSDIFTQDLEDAEEDAKPKPQPQPAPAKQPAPEPVSAERFKFLMGRMGWTWENVYHALDKKNGTTHQMAKTPFDRLDPGHVAQLAAWMERQPAKQQPETVPPDRGDAYEEPGGN